MKGWTKPHNGPYGSHRGNRVLHAKRVHGPSARSILLGHIANERCTECGAQPVLLTEPAMDAKRRRCEACIERHAMPVERHANISKLLKLPWQ